MRWGASASPMLGSNRGCKCDGAQGRRRSVVDVYHEAGTRSSKGGHAPYVADVDTVRVIQHKIAGPDVENLVQSARLRLHAPDGLHPTSWPCRVAYPPTRCPSRALTGSPRGRQSCSRHHVCREPRRLEIACVHGCRSPAARSTKAVLPADRRSLANTGPADAHQHGLYKQAPSATWSPLRDPRAAHPSSLCEGVALGLLRSARALHQLRCNGSGAGRTEVGKSIPTPGEKP